MATSTSVLRSTGLARLVRGLLALVLALAAIGLVACGGASAERSSDVTSVRSSNVDPGIETSVDSDRDVDPDDQGDRDDRYDRDAQVVVFLGDSLTAGYGLEQDEAFPARIGEALRAEGVPVRIVNAGVSGDTTAGGLRRLDWILRQQPDVVVVVLGGNDGLRGLDLEVSEENLRRIVERARAAGARVLLGGMLLPPSYGEDYTSRFAAMYPRVAEDLDVALVPFVLEGVGGVAELNLPDGIHPNAAGQRRLADTVLEHLRPLLDEADERPGDGDSRDAA